MAVSRRIGEGTGPATARELQAIVHAERDGAPFFVFRGTGGEQRIVCLRAGQREFTVGRSAAADLSIAGDDQVSALHAVIELLAGELTLRDEGLSRNGSYVNGERVHGMRRLRDGDLLRLGRTVVLVRNPTDAERRATSAAPHSVIVTHLSDQQRKVLTALCRPVGNANALRTPATNQEIADELHLSVAAVKLHLRTLFTKFQIADLPQNKKRLALMERALRSELPID